jgi:leucyl-tRNA synthetase
MSDVVNISFQINGKFRETFSAKIDLNDEEMKSLVKETETYKKYILETESGNKESEIKKIIIVKNKLINIVI